MRFACQFLAALLLATLVGSVVSVAQDKAEPKEAPRKLTVAVLSFDAKDPGNADMGSQLSEMVTAVLSGEDNFELVDRTSLRQTLAENELNLTGLVSADQAIKVGKLVGAKILVTGRAFRLGKDMYITAKIIGTETSRVEAVMVKGDPKDDVGELAMGLCQKIDERIVARGEALTGADLVRADPLPQLIRAAATIKEKPVLAVVVTEQHMAGPRPAARRPIPDPAVETELKRLLGQAGFKIKDVPQNELAEWAPEDAWPRSLEGVDLVITGEALSEFASRIGNLINCAARAEINVISREDGRVVLAERTTARAVDLAENIAGKTALQKAGRQLAVPLLKYLGPDNK
jgi:TolB-like protein